MVIIADQVEATANIDGIKRILSQRHLWPSALATVVVVVAVVVQVVVVPVVVVVVTVVASYQ